MAKANKIFGTDGVRGKVGQSLINPEFVLKLGWAAGRVLSNGKRGKVLIGKDTRISGYMLESALQAGLSAAGINIRLLGPMPTPGIAYLTRTLRAVAGIVISASHNPFDDNGIKFFSARGTKLDDDVEAQIEEQMMKPMTTVDSANLGNSKRIVDAAGRYIEFCKSTIPSRTRMTGMKVVVDCAHGATYYVAPNVFREVGAEVVRIGVDPDGFNINAECGSTHPTLLQKAVKEHQADIGIALDGDGDRLIMVDNKGDIVDGDELLYVIVKDAFENGKLQGGVVGTVMSNLGLELAFQELGIEFIRTAVGDRFIMEKLNQKQWYLGGEPSGHIVCLNKTTTGDGIVSALQVLYAMQRTGKSLRELVKDMKKYPQTTVNVPTDNASNVVAHPSVLKTIQDVESQLKDNGRVLLRPSGTEPLVRVMVEGKDSKTVSNFANQIADVVKQQAGAG